jgi:hypothetical protein
MCTFLCPPVPPDGGSQVCGGLREDAWTQDRLCVHGPNSSLRGAGRCVCPKGHSSTVRDISVWSGARQR